MAATLAVIVAGLVVIGSRQNDTNPVTDQPVSKRSVATDLPDGWEITGAGEALPNSTATGLFEVRLYATASAPAGPALALMTSDDGFDASASDLVEKTLANGRRAAIGTSHFGGARWLDVEVVSGTWVGVLAQNIDDERLLQIGADIRIGIDGVPMLDASSLRGAKPLVDVGVTHLLGGPLMTSMFGSDPEQWVSGLVLTGYASTVDGSSAEIAAFVPTPMDDALLGVLGSVSRLSNVGSSESTSTSTYAVDYGDGSGYGVYRKSGGVAFFARSQSLELAQLVPMLDSMVAVDDLQWATLVEQRRRTDDTADGPIMSPVTTAVPPPSPTDAASAPTNVEVTYAIAQDGDDLVASAEIPAGDVAMTIEFRGRMMHVDAALNGEILSTTDLSATEGSSHGSISGEADSPYFYAYVTDVGGPSAELRVTADGIEYSTQFVVLDPTYPVRIAMLLIPPNSERTSPPIGYTYAADGTPIQPA